ncbi:AraC family transcriptional regulator, partial [Burkholderia cepacia]|nr:AraC family transcriptional regulator [Burkholderia cepacia]MBA9948376.1 AraC family transcriptional regulator [Burkholderia cepacia]MBA9978574.1 AraC family transcriptional regulator [Burkholderia cepacia]MBA9997287.1 AraC family transcriptional regulator [Burkholderia cepacia]MBB0005264.1 AraC family transcriptional regulator [Burkholderia cepacia]
MNPVGQALWLIETELDRELTLDRISTGCDMS